MKNAIYTATLALFFIVSLTPLSFIPVKIWNVPFHYIFLSATVSALLVAGSLTGKRPTSFSILVILLLSVFSLSIITSVDRSNTARTIASFFLRGLAIGLVAEQIGTRGRTESFMRFMVFCGAALSFLGLIEFFFKWNPFFYIAPGMADCAIPGRPGMLSTVGHPLPLGSFLVLILPVSLAFSVNSTKTINYLFFVFISSCLVLSFSRSSWLSAIVALAVFFSLQDYRSLIKKKYSFFLFALPLLILPFIFFQPARKAIITRTNAEALYNELFASHRAASYVTTAHILRKSWLLGIGMGNYPKVYETYRTPGTDCRFFTPDNMYLRLLSETGLVGTCAFMAFLIFWFARLWIYRYDKIIAALLSGLTGFLVNMMAADLFYILLPQFTFWIMVGFSAARLTELSHDKSIPVALRN